MRFAFSRCLGVTVLIVLFSTTFRTDAEQLPPDLDYFPSRLHAAVFRNWDIVPHERIAAVLQTDRRTIEKTGKELGLTLPQRISAEDIHRNIENVLRRNWGVLPRNQIEQLLNYTPAQLDDFLGKEISLRALLAGQPPGLTPVKYLPPNEETKVRAQWFAAKVKGHLDAVKGTPEEPRLGYVAELCRAHNPADHVKGTKPRSGDADLRSNWRIQIPPGSSEFLRSAAQDFRGYCRDVHRVRGMDVAEMDSFHESIWLSKDSTISGAEGYSLKVVPSSITLKASTDLGLARGLVELERRMGERGGPFLKTTSETNAPVFGTRYVYSYFSILTDVLGQDVVEAHPDGYLNELFHQDADGVWVYALMEDLVPSPVFPEIRKTGSEQRLQRLRDLVNRAAKRGLKVYVYLNEPRAQFLPFFQKYPDIKGHQDGDTAALCTSTEPVQKHIRGSFEKLFSDVPGLGGVFVITASENMTSCYSRAYGKRTNCARCAKRAPEDVVTEVVKSMTDGAWGVDPKAKIIVWDWSWHSVMGEEVPEKIISQLPKGVALMADFERGTGIVRGGIPMSVEEYSISVVGPSPRAQVRSKQAKQFDLDFLAKIQLSTTWECGTVPFIPVPNLLWRKADALDKVGASGVMATWTIGSYPSPNTEAFAIRNWNPDLSETEALRRVAARRYGESATDDAVRGWTKLSAAFHEEFPYSAAPYSGPLQHGPSLPWYGRDIPPPYGTVTLFNPKDDWRNWTPPYPQDVMAKLLRAMCDRWDAGMADLREAATRVPAARRGVIERDLGVAWMIGYYYRAYANALHFYGARDGKDPVEMKRLATEERKQTREALRLVRADSRLGWQAELQYFYRPNDVLEKLISLDAIIEPPAK